jgi:Zn-dependent peptidase ImmA (M78 family)
MLIQGYQGQCEIFREAVRPILESPRQAISVLDESEIADSSLLFRVDNPEKCGPELRMLLARKAYNYASVEKLAGESPTLPPSLNLNICDPQILEAMGRGVRGWLGVNEAPLGDVLSLLESKGLKILQHPFPSELSGFSAYSEEVGGVIFVNAKHPTKRKNSAVLHELGHLIFHRSEYGKVLVEKDREKEMAINHFVGAVLMPSNVLEKELHLYRQRWIPEPLLHDLKLRYQISAKMVLIRATQVGLIQIAQKEQQCAVLEKNYEIRKKGEASSPPRTFYRLERLVYNAVLMGDISISKAAKILGKPLVEIHAALRNCLETSYCGSTRW